MMLALGTLGIASRTDSQAKPTASAEGPGVGLVEKSVFLVAGALDRHEGSDFASA